MLAVVTFITKAVQIAVAGAIAIAAACLIGTYIAIELVCNI